jgi:hypothetical protein
MNLRRLYRGVGFWVVSGAGMAVSLLFSGCSTGGQKRASRGADDARNLAATHPTREQGGAQLWSERCTQCHYARDPGTFSQEQWEIIMMHMRIRANLTAVEHRTILEFFKPKN